MNGWKSDKAWSDKYIPEIKRILGEYLIAEAPLEEDRDNNTDLIVLSLAAVRIGCRVRRSSYYPRYGNEFTIRSSRPNGNKTELRKIIEGWGDYFFYGIVSGDDTPGFATWTLGNLNVFRGWYATQLWRNGGALPGMSKTNGDNSSGFHAFKISELPSDFIVARFDISCLTTANNCSIL